MNDPGKFFFQSDRRVFCPSSQAAFPFKKILGIVAACCLCFGQSLFAAEDADSVYLNGRIYTEDKARAWAEAVAIKDGRFIAVGKDQEIKKFIGKVTTVTDLKGRMAMPGIHDAHTHLVNAGYYYLYTCFIRSATDINDLSAQLTACKEKIRPHSPWLVVNTGFQPASIAGFNKAFLDDIFPDIAAAIRDDSRHNLFANSQALSLAGIDRNTPQPEHGSIDKDPVTGEPTGLLIDVASRMILARVLASYSVAEQDRAARFAIETNSRYGVTSVQDAGVSAAELKILHRLEKRGELLQFVSAHLIWGDALYPAADESLFKPGNNFSSSLLDVNGVKVWLDGAPLPPYFTHVTLRADGTIDRTHLLVDEDVLTKKLAEWDKNGLRAKMHVSGAGSTRIALNAVEQARKQNGPWGPIHELGHANTIAKKDLPRLKQLNVVAEMSPGFGALADPNNPFQARFWQYRTLIENGALVTAGSDFPMIEPNPFPWLQIIVTRYAESISMADALTILTRNGAKVIGREKDLGSIETGKFANMIVLNQNLFDIPTSEIAKTEVIKTLFKGRVVYKK